jgi:hypothetical protein
MLCAVNWLLVVIPALASGILGSIVTTYGTQARERRAARTAVRTQLQLTEQLGRRPYSPEGRDRLAAALEQMEDAALMAALPHYLISFYSRMRLRAYETIPTATPGGTYDPRSRRVVSLRLASSTAVLMVQALWHPWLSRLTRNWRMRRLRHILRNVMPDEADKLLGERSERRTWERNLLGGRAKNI